MSFEFRTPFAGRDSPATPKSEGLGVTQNSELRTQNSRLDVKDGSFCQLATVCGGIQEVADPADEVPLFRLTNNLASPGLAPLQVPVQARNPALFDLGLGLLMVEQVDQQHANTKLETLRIAPPCLRH